MGHRVLEQIRLFFNFLLIEEARVLLPFSRVSLRPLACQKQDTGTLNETGALKACQYQKLMPLA